MYNVKNNKKIIFFYILVSFVIFFFYVENFRLFHDQFFKFDLVNYDASVNLLFQNFNLNSVSGVGFYVTIYDRLLLYILYSFIDKTSHVLFLILWFKITLLILATYFSFIKIIKINKIIIDNYFLTLVVIFYAFSPFALLYWHGNSFSLSLLLVYVLGPVLIYNIDKIFLANDTKKCYENFIYIFIICFLTLPGFYLSLPLYFFCFIYSLQFYSRYKKKLFFKKILSLFLINIPNVLIIIPLLIEFNISTTGIDKSIISENTYSNIRHGVFAAIAGISTWGYYVNWEDYPLFLSSKINLNFFMVLLFSTLFICLVFSLDFSKKICRYLIILILLALVLSKGAALPFGYLYTSLIKIDLMLFLRSPDNKINFIFCLFFSLALLRISKESKIFYLIEKSCLTFITFVSFMIFIFLTFPKKNMPLNNSNFINYEFLDSLKFINNKKFKVIATIPTNVSTGRYKISKENTIYFSSPYLVFSSFPFIEIKDYEDLISGKSDFVIWYKYNSIPINDAEILKVIIKNHKIIYENSFIKIFDITSNNGRGLVEMTKNRKHFSDVKDYYFLGKFDNEDEKINLKFINSNWMYFSYICKTCFFDYKFMKFKENIILNNNVILFNFPAIFFKIIFSFNLGLIITGLILIFLKKINFSMRVINIK